MSCVVWRYIFGVGQRVYACVFLFGIEEREVENGELDKEKKEEREFAKYFEDWCEIEKKKYI